MISDDCASHIHEFCNPCDCPCHDNELQRQLQEAQQERDDAEKQVRIALIMNRKLLDQASAAEAQCATQTAQLKDIAKLVDIWEAGEVGQMTNCVNEVRDVLERSGQ